MNFVSFDLISLMAGLICIQTLFQLFRNWSKFWDDRVTFNDRQLAQQLAVFVLIPIGVLLHEIGHSLATWQVGGTVLSFQWRFYWGYIVPSGNFTPVESWWISFSGNLVSILLGLLPIPFILGIRKRIVAEVLYSYAVVESIYSLIGYPLLSLGSRAGDWVNIYDFAVQPYASLTLVGHLGLLWGLWQLYHSRPALHWRLAGNSNALDTWEHLKASTAARPRNLELHLELAYFLLDEGEIYAARKVNKKFDLIAPNNDRVRVFRVALACARRWYRQAIQSGQQLLDKDISPEDRLRLYRVLCFSSYKRRQLSEALSYADRGLEIDPKNYKLRCHRAIVYWMLKQYQAARADLDVALESLPDEGSRQQFQDWVKQSLKGI